MAYKQGANGKRALLAVRQLKSNKIIRGIFS